MSVFTLAGERCLAVRGLGRSVRGVHIAPTAAQAGRGGEADVRLPAPIPAWSRVGPRSRFPFQFPSLFLPPRCFLWVARRLPGRISRTARQGPGRPRPGRPRDPYGHNMFRQQPLPCLSSPLLRAGPRAVNAGGSGGLAPQFYPHQTARSPVSSGLAPSESRQAYLLLRKCLAGTAQRDARWISLRGTTWRS